jgi:hypothetical protein
VDAASLVRPSAKREEVSRIRRHHAPEQRAIRPNEYAMIVHHRQGAPARRRAPKEVATKPSAACAALQGAFGNPPALNLTGGNAHNITQAEPLAASRTRSPLANADSFITRSECARIKAVTTPKSNRKANGCDRALYAERNLVERFLSK